MLGYWGGALWFLASVPTLLLEICVEMGGCTLWLTGAAGLAVVGWALAFIYRRRALRYRAAFDRAFGLAARAHNFTSDEKTDLTPKRRE